MVKCLFDSLTNCGKYLENEHDRSNLDSPFYQAEILKRTFLERLETTQVLLQVANWHDPCLLRIRGDLTDVGTQGNRILRLMLDRTQKPDQTINSAAQFVHESAEKLQALIEEIEKLNVTNGSPVPPPSAVRPSAEIRVAKGAS